MSATGTITLHNKCHGASDGKFCETPGPGASGGDWPTHVGREMTVTTSTLLHPIKVDGVRVKAKYSVKAADGTEINAFFAEGKANPARIKQSLNTVASLHELYPSKPPRHILVLGDRTTRLAVGADGPYVGAWTYQQAGFSHKVFINSDNLHSGRFDKIIKEPQNKDWFMPEVFKQDSSHYLMTHEVGHQVDFMKKSNSAKELFDNPAIKKHLSTYGQSLVQEGYAEAFAEWHTSHGKTSNPAARAYAVHEGWYGTDGYKKQSLTASAEVIMEFQNEVDDNVDASKLVPKDSNGIIADTFDPKHKPMVKGIKTAPVSEEAKKKADKIVEEVYRSMGFDANGDPLKYDKASATGQIQLSLEEEKEFIAQSTGKIALSIREADEVENQITWNPWEIAKDLGIIHGD